MNKYFEKVQEQDTFDELIEVSFVGGGHYVQLIYMESV
jgi:hypothetical protein